MQVLELLIVFCRATENTTSPSSGRLNDPYDAWCFLYGDVPRTSAVAFTVDLGEAALVSGFQSQGPPRSKHGDDYLRYVGLRLLLSDDGRSWRGCCEDRQELVSMRVTF